MNETSFPIKRGWSRVVWRPQALRRPGVDAYGFPALVAAVLGLYALLRAPVLDPHNYLDPWIYTASFVNFDSMYSLFGSTYYLSRLPWLIPGIAAHALLPPVAAFFLLHAVFFAGGALFAFLLVRRFLGRPAAYIAASTLMLCPLYYNAHSNDYPDGGLVTYLLGAAYFGIGAFGSARRTPRLVGAGFCIAAAAAINLVSVVLVLGLGLAYFVVCHIESGFWRRLARDAAAAAAGVLVLLLACGAFAVAHGGEFLFFMPQWRFARANTTSDWKLHGYGWLPYEPQILIPLFLLLALAALLAATRLRGWNRDPALRFAAGSGAFLLFLTGLVFASEFGFDGNWLEIQYYFSMFTVPFVLVIGSLVHLLGRRGALVAIPRAATVAVLVAAAPVWIVYGLRLGPVGRDASLVAVVLMVVALAAVGLTTFWRAPVRRHQVVAAFAVVSLLVAVNYAGAAGRTTRGVFVNGSSEFSSRRATLSMAMQLIDFMRSNGLQRSVPAFWYDNGGGSELNGIQSTYLWGTTAIGFDMPHFDAGERTLLEARRPLYIVLLCRSPSCEGGPAALQRAGYHLRPEGRTVIAAGGRRYWVAAYRLPKFRPLDALARYYQPAQARFASGSTHKPLWSVSFGRGLPEGWSGSATIVAGEPARATTRPNPWEYSIISPRQTLEPGAYRLYLSGKVLAGGLDLGALDLDVNRWIVQRSYWFRQGGFDRGWMTAGFRVDEPTRVQFVLSNWVPHELASRWELRELRLVRLP
jgi:hypothetical protein